jgi:hypothetical protein
MLEFQLVKDKVISFGELTQTVTQSDLAMYTNEMVDTMLDLVEGCEDEDVTFVPVDPLAHDPYAENADGSAIAWTLGHVVVHVTASSEEAAAIAAEMARGVEPHGRSRYETAWETVTTMDQARQRLEESRRMRLASLACWPDEPHLEVSFSWGPDKPKYNAIQRFVLGLRHDFDHLGQIEEIVRQATEQRHPVRV